MKPQSNQAFLPPVTLAGRRVPFLSGIRLANPVIYILALFVFLTAPVLALAWSARPFPGFVVEQTLVVSDYKGPGWTGWEAGIRYPQRVTHLEGRAVSTNEEFERALGEFTLGQIVDIDTVLPDGTALHYPSIELVRFSNSDLFRLFVLPYAVGLAYLILGVWVLTMRWQTRAGRAFAYFSACTALVNGLLFDLITTHTLTPVWVLGMAQVGGAMLSLALVFPEEWFLVKRLDGLHYLPYVISTLLAVWGLVVMKNSANPWAYVWSWRASYIFTAVGIAVLVGMMAYRFWTTQSVVVRQQARLILAGSLVSYLPSGLWMAAPLFGFFPSWNPILFLPLLMVFPITIAVAILRYRLWDIDVIVNRTLVYGSLTLMLGVIYLAGVLVIQQIFVSITGEETQLAIALSTLGTATLFNPLRRRVQDFIDRRLYRRKYDAARTLAEFSVAVRDEVDLTRLLQRVEQVIQLALHPTYLMLWLRSQAVFGLQMGDNDPHLMTPDLDSRITAIGEGDPLVQFLLDANGALKLEWIDVVSPAMEGMRAGRLALVVPLISQGEMVGWIGLGPRLSAQGYSLDDRTLLNHLANQAAPALRVAQLVHQQQAEARERERFEHEMHVARVIQQGLLPKTLPDLPNWKIATHYQPARAVGGDFYDFIQFDDGRLGLMIGDVSDKGIPAAMVMATTRTLFHAIARSEVSPGQALARVNDLLVDDIPSMMFVTCLYAILDPITGSMQFANAGHNLPCLKTDGVVAELRATGMPLGLMPEMQYEEKQADIPRQGCLILYSDGLVEAHNNNGEMYSVPRLHANLANHHQPNHDLVSCMLTTLSEFTGEGWEQEDDVTLVTMHRF